jgi:hypothetical protein
MPDRWAGFYEMLRTPACTRQMHADCPHRMGMGGGFNPRRLRLEVGAGLCRCSCHSFCPVANTGKRMTVPMKTWYTSCTCPGADLDRERLDQAEFKIRDFAELREEAQHRRRESREAFESARARSAGKSREEIRDLYLAQLRARDLKAPPDPILDAIVERILGNPLPAARVAGETLVDMGKAIHQLYRLFSPRNPGPP